MDGWWLIFALAAAVAVFWWRSRRKAESEPSSSLDALDTVADWEPQPTRILSAQERLAHAVLLRALPDHIILAQVPVSRFIKVPTRHSYAEWQARVGHHCVDFAICDPSSQVLAVVNVQPPPERITERSRRRHQRVARVLKAARIPLHVWIENALPTAEAARAAIVAPAPAAGQGAGLRAASSAPQASAASAGEAPRPILEPARAERPEAVEPPPSSWFDQLTSRPAPLQKQGKRKT